MYQVVDPRQTRLFDPFDNVLTERTRRRLLDGWAGVFRHIILELMPVETVSGYFDPALGRPSKELYSMAGLFFAAGFFGWTQEEAPGAFTFPTGIP